MTALLAAGAVGLTLTACGAADDADVVDEPTAAGSAPAGDVDEAAVEPVVVEDLVALSEQMAAAQAEHPTVHVESGVGGDAAEEAGMGEFTQSADIVLAEKFEDMRMRMTMDMMGLSMEALLVDSTMYMDMSAMSGGEVGYVSIDLEDLEDEPGMAGALDTLDSADAAAQAEAVADAVQSFEHTGTETVDGQEVEVYTATIDPTLASDPASLGLDQEMLDEMARTTMDMVFRVTEDGLPTSIDIVMEIEGQEFVATTAYSDWGEDVTVEAPPASKVTPYDEAMGAGAGA